MPHYVVCDARMPHYIERELDWKGALNKTSRQNLKNKKVESLAVGEARKTTFCPNPRQKRLESHSFECSTTGTLISASGNLTLVLL